MKLAINQALWEEVAGLTPAQQAALRAFLDRLLPNPFDPGIMSTVEHRGEVYQLLVPPGMTICWRIAGSPGSQELVTLGVFAETERLELLSVRG